MRIKENSYDGNDSYSTEMQKRLEKIFRETLQVLEAKSLLSEIKKDSAELRNLFWTEEELRQRQEEVSFFDARMQAMVFYTLKNLEGYQQSGWKELMNEGESRDGTNDPD